MMKQFLNSAAQLNSYVLSYFLPVKGTRFARGCHAEFIEARRVGESGRDHDCAYETQYTSFEYLRMTPSLKFKCVFQRLLAVLSLSVLCLFSLTTTLFAQQEKTYIHKGNELYKQQKYKEAEASYRKSVEKKNQTVEGNFNLGDALFKQKNFAAAGDQFTKIAASSANNKQIAANAYHNLGNSLFESKKLEESIEAYKKSLLNNPKDDQTRYNLAYAQEMLKKQKDQDKKNKDDKNQDKNKDQNKKDQDKKDQDKKDQDKKDQDKKDQNKDQDKKDQDKKDQQKQPDKLSKEDAERMLEALNNAEQNTQDKLKNKKLKGVKVRVTKDW